MYKKDFTRKLIKNQQSYKKKTEQICPVFINEIQRN
jgi:hypothetical protein